MFKIDAIYILLIRFYLGFQDEVNGARLALSGPHLQTFKNHFEIISSGSRIIFCEEIRRVLSENPVSEYWEEVHTGFLQYNCFVAG